MFKLTTELFMKLLSNSAFTPWESWSMLYDSLEKPLYYKLHRISRCFYF